jgi:glyoxylate reductase
LAFSLLVSVARRIPEGDRFMREGRFQGWAPELMLGTDIHGKILGIIGLGRIGTLVAKRALGFDMKVLYNSANRKPDMEKELGIQYAEVDEILKESDFISLHVPLTPQTKGLIGKRELDIMKPSVILINTSRGEVVDEPALINALKNNRIRGAALDVFWGEPTDVSSQLYELDNAVLAPHMGSASLETRSKMAEMTAQAVIDSLEGREPQHVVNPEVLKK